MRLSHYLAHIDWGLLAPVFVLLGLSLTTLFSISDFYFKNQLIYAVFSFFVYLFFTNIDYKSLRLFSVPIYITALISFVIVLLLGIESKGAVRWLEIFGVSIQLSEVFKPFLAIALASFLAARSPSARTLFITLLLLTPVVFLIYKQPDLGSALLYVFAALFTFFFYGISFLWFGIGAGILAIVLPIFWHLMHEYQRQRIITFLYPSNDPLGTAYNATQALIAVGAGGVFGRGFGEGTQSLLQFLPERHTDFIFATLSEQFGFFGTIVLFTALGFLLYRIMRLIMTSDDRFVQLFAAIVFFFFLVQLFVNIGMNMGIVPIAGITLPFVSYGGSSLLSNFIFLGLLSAMSTVGKKRSLLEIR